MMPETGGQKGFQVRCHDRIIHLTLDRPEVRNAFDEVLIDALAGLFAQWAHDDTVRALVLRGAGTHFSAGADLHWMRRAAHQNREANHADALRFEAMLRGLDELPFPVIALVQGAAIGGGLGLTACADIAIAADNAVFAATEVRLGIVPAVISPYVIRAIGARQARRYFLTAERFDAATARRLGLVHEVAAPDELESRADTLLASIAKGGPQALAATKLLVREVPHLQGSLRGGFTAQMIAERRGSDEGREGIQAFLDKRQPNF